MSMRVRRGLSAGGVVIVVAGLLWLSAPRGVVQALRECLRPTTVEMMPLPSGCIQTNEPPPQETMRIVEQQKAFYHLTLQKVVVCRTAQRFPQIEPDFSIAAFDEGTRKRWLPVYAGCDTYQFRRHFAVVAVSEGEKGSLVAEAALVQSRWVYLRMNWRKVMNARW